MNCALFLHNFKFCRLKQFTSIHLIKIKICVKSLKVSLFKIIENENDALIFLP